MTCVVGIEDKGKVWIGADSQATGGWEAIERLDSKVFYNDEMLMGCSGSYRMTQLLQYELVVPKQTQSNDMKYMVVDFIGAIRALFKKHGYGTTESGEDEHIGKFLVGYKRTLYTIEGDYQVGVTASGFNAIGSGAAYALGALSIMRPNTMPINRVRRALDVSAKFDIGVSSPFEILHI